LAAERSQAAAVTGQSGMKHSVMTRHKDTLLPPPNVAVRGKSGGPDAAFDLWLQRRLHQLFDTVAKEPIPEELMRLIEQDRQK
jgi:hypothetical protein